MNAVILLELAEKWEFLAKRPTKQGDSKADGINQAREWCARDLRDLVNLLEK